MAEETKEEKDKRYVCPQCGPDPRGADVHAFKEHSFAGLMGFATEEEYMKESN